MASLKFNPAWSADDQAKIAEALGLNEKLQNTLFVQHKALNVKGMDDDELAKAISDAIAPAVEAEETTVEETETETVETEETETEVDPGHSDAKDADVIDVHTATQRDRAAVEAAAVIDKAVSKVIDEGFEAQGKVRITPLLVHQAMTVAAKAAKQSLGDYPFPNSYLEKSKTVVGTGKAKIDLGNEPYDRFTFRARKPGADKETEQHGSFYKTQYEKSEAGKALQVEYDFASKCIANYGEWGVNSDLLGKYKGRTRKYIERTRKAMESHKVYAINRLRDAVKHDRQLRAFQNIPKHEGAPVVKFETEKVGDVRVYLNKFDPVSIYYWGYTDDDETVDPSKRELTLFLSGDYSLASFWRFNVAKAIAAAGGADKVTLQHILDTVKRQSKTPDDTKKTEGRDDWAKHDIENIRQFELVTYSMSNYLKVNDDAEVNTKRVAQIEALLDNPDGEFLEAFGDLMINGDDIWTRYASKYRAHKEARRKTREAEAKAKQAA